MRVVFFGRGGCHGVLRVEDVPARLLPKPVPGRRVHCLTPWMDRWQQLSSAANDAVGGQGGGGYRR
ncbi:MAG: hypothetical protein R3F22_04620 [Lysobacteraceae bacterium]